MEKRFAALLAWLKINLAVDDVPSPDRPPAPSLLIMDRAQRTHRARNRPPPDVYSIHSQEVEEAGLEEMEWPEEEEDPTKWEEEEAHHKQHPGTRLDDSMESAASGTVGVMSMGQAAGGSGFGDPAEGSTEAEGGQHHIVEQERDQDGIHRAQCGVRVLHGRLIAHKWKQFCWMLRIKAAVERDRQIWRRNPRWLAGMFSKEVAAIWGHLGGATRVLSGVRGPPMMR